MGLRTIERLKTRGMVLAAGFVQPDRLEYDQVVLDATEFAQLFRRSDALDEVLLSVRTCITPGTHDGSTSGVCDLTGPQRCQCHYFDRPDRCKIWHQFCSGIFFCQDAT